MEDITVWLEIPFPALNSVKIGPTLFSVMLVVLEGVLVVVHGQEFGLLASLHSLNGRQRGHLSGPSRVS